MEVSRAVHDFASHSCLLIRCQIWIGSYGGMIWLNQKSSDTEREVYSGLSHCRVVMNSHSMDAFPYLSEGVFIRKHSALSALVVSLGGRTIVVYHTRKLLMLLLGSRFCVPKIGWLALGLRVWGKRLTS